MCHCFFLLVLALLKADIHQRCIQVHSSQSNRQMTIVTKHNQVLHTHTHAHTRTHTRTRTRTRTRTHLLSTHTHTLASNTHTHTLTHAFLCGRNPLWCVACVSEMAT